MNCEICEKVFKSKNILKRHFDSIHGINVEKAKENICNICSKTYQSNGILTLHIKTVHEKLKPYKC